MKLDTFPEYLIFILSTPRFGTIVQQQQLTVVPFKKLTITGEREDINLIGNGDQMVHLSIFVRCS